MTPEIIPTTVYDCSMITLPRHHSDRRGNLSVVENGPEAPFDVRRVFYMYDVPGGVDRGAHAHRHLRELLVAAGGSFTVTLDDGRVKRSFLLNRPYMGLIVEPGIWASLHDFSSGAVCLVLASEPYDEPENIRTYEEFLKLKGIE